jgi:hypothetical protein
LHVVDIANAPPRMKYAGPEAPSTGRRPIGRESLPALSSIGQRQGFGRHGRLTPRPRRIQRGPPEQAAHPYVSCGTKKPRTRSTDAFLPL